MLSGKRACETVPLRKPELAHGREIEGTGKARGTSQEKMEKAGGRKDDMTDADKRANTGRNRSPLARVILHGARNPKLPL